MLSLSIPPLTSITAISTPHQRYLLPSKTHSISPPSVLKPCVLFASRLAPFEKRPLLSRFQLAVSSASDSSGQEEVKEEVENRSFADILFSKQEKPATDGGEEVTNDVEEGIEPVEDVQEEEEEGGYEYEEYEDEEEDSEYEDDEDYDEYNERLYSSTPKVVLKFIWMEKNIGLGLERHVPGSGSVPLTPYFFWPRKDAWEELKSAMEERPLVSEKRKIILLNQATDIINLWQQSGVVPSPTL